MIDIPFPTMVDGVLRIRWPVTVMNQWLQDHIPEDYRSSDPRWRCVVKNDGPTHKSWYIRFRDDRDATCFLLLWSDHEN